MISIVVPVYNVEEYLRECVDSVLGQTYGNFEIILVNDGSTDSSPAICEEYARKDSRVRVIHRENRGVSAARNAGVEAAKGDYIFFLDSDDYLPADALEILHDLAKEHDSDFVVGTFVRLLESGRIRPAFRRDPVRGVEIYTGKDKMHHLIRVPKHADSVWGKLYARELFDGIRFPEGKIYEDVCVTYLLVHKARRIVFTEKCSYVYRKRAGSIMLHPCSDQDYDVVEGRLQERDFVLQHYPELEHHANVRTFATVFKLVLRSASGKISDKEKWKTMQRLVRKYLPNYLKCRAARKKKLLAMLAFVNLDLARLAVKVYIKNFPEDDV